LYDRRRGVDAPPRPRPDVQALHLVVDGRLQDGVVFTAVRARSLRAQQHRHHHRRPHFMAVTGAFGLSNGASSTTAAQPMTLYQRKPMSLAAKTAMTSACATSVAMKTAVPLTRFKKNPVRKTPSIGP